MESPGLSRKAGWALLSFSDVAYNESFYGYSAAGHGDAELLARYVHLFVHSLIWMHYALLTSPKFGVERRKFYKTVLDDCPIIPLSSLTEGQQNAIRCLSDRLEREDTTVFDEIDSFFGSLYGLGRLDLEVIRDTLDVSLPYDKSRRRACRAPSATERESFRRRLESVLRPFFKVLDKEPKVDVWRPDDPFLQKKAPFGIVLVGVQGRVSADPDTMFREMILKLADDTGATRIIQQMKGGLQIGILSQYRYWTTSRARLLGAEIIGQHMAALED
jgi:hypothetical protein